MSLSGEISKTSAVEDFRFKSYELLLELDAANNKMMMLVSARELSGVKWSAAVERHSDAYGAWISHMNEYSGSNPFTS
ncbi:hypothetical protein [Pseudomonas sp. HY13-MNA-CIBAN-0226]|uniref:hypothetical protein n=1 Tax=Pseudomonas sp. HY13-MNA-CIBAN-0226 TaxID=3140473 RepID=UPI00332260B0